MTVNPSTEILERAGVYEVTFGCLQIVG